MANFADCIDYVLQNEGVDSDHPSDTGGRTRYGITRAVAKRHGLDVETLTLAQAKAIYCKDYWSFDGVASNRVASKLLDIVVPCGVRGGTSLIQRAVDVNPDGKFGPKTLAAVNALMPDVAIERVSMSLMDHFVDICKRNPEQLAFLKGWARRAIRRPR